MRILEARSEDDAHRWRHYVDGTENYSHYHRWGWKQVIEDAFGWPTYYLMAEEEGRIAGVLPLVWQKSWLFGSFLTSLPFLSGGGVAACSQAVEEGRVQEASALARRLNVSHVELRHRREPNGKFRVVVSRVLRPAGSGTRPAERQ